MSLQTNYLGMTLRTPLVVSASPLSQNLDNIKRMADAGASAVVLYSLFEEQLMLERYELHHHLTHGTESFAEALSFFPEPEFLQFGLDSYLEHIRRAKQAVDIPIIASLNGTALGRWTESAKRIYEAGADALELNIYSIPTDPELTGAEVEQNYLDIVAAVKAAVKIPVAVKLGPFFSSFANMARRLDDVGADALVLFNRFYQPDFDLEALEVKTNVLFSRSSSIRLPLRWIAILYGQIRAQLAATSGVHSAIDALKLLMAGANVTMLCSVLYERGLPQIGLIERAMLEWMDKHEYVSVAQMRGSLSQLHCSDPTAYERALYVQAVHTFKPQDL
ncbi:MAG: dihydroorotate dehydrogenase-like protein [Acidobacteriota bacterium]|nr:dihydroorotate dehydrogenase-like protein [Acidobacteriota bacterium]